MSGGADTALGRVSIDWQRVDLSNGYTVALSAQAVDNLGRKGMAGRLDLKNKEQVTGIVTSTISSVVSANTMDKLISRVPTSQQGAQNIAAANAIVTGTTQYQSQPQNTDAEKIGVATSICTLVMSNVTDITATYYSTANTACAPVTGSVSLCTNTCTSNAANPCSNCVSQAIAVATQTAAALQSANVINQDRTLGRQAAEAGFQNLSQSLQNMLNNQQYLRPTISLNQGQPIKIYVNNDISVPSDVIIKARGK
jgi:type IV secretion system protein VirB10